MFPFIQDEKSPTKCYLPFRCFFPLQFGAHAGDFRRCSAGYPTWHRLDFPVHPFFRGTRTLSLCGWSAFLLKWLTWEACMQLLTNPCRLIFHASITCRVYVPHVSPSIMASLPLGCCWIQHMFRLLYQLCPHKDVFPVQKTLNWVAAENNELVLTAFLHVTILCCSEYLDSEMSSMYIKQKNKDLLCTLKDVILVLKANKTSICMIQTYFFHCCFSSPLGKIFILKF